MAVQKLEEASSLQILLDYLSDFEEGLSSGDIIHFENKDYNRVIDITLGNIGTDKEFLRIFPLHPVDSEEHEVVYIRKDDKLVYIRRGGRITTLASSVLGIPLVNSRTDVYSVSHCLANALNDGDKLFLMQFSTAVVGLLEQSVYDIIKK